MNDLLANEGNISADTLEKVMDEVYERSMDIPFENSTFQDDMFIINAQHTPARAYRATLLRLSSKLRALNETRHSIIKENIDIEELEHMIEMEQVKEYPNEFEIRRWRADIEFKLSNRKHLDKLVKDCIVDVQHLYNRMRNFHAYTRDEFEAEEREHYKIRLAKQALGITGPMESLDNMGERIGSTEDLKALAESKSNRKLIES